VKGNGIEDIIYSAIPAKYICKKGYGPELVPPLQQ